VQGVSVVNWPLRRLLLSVFANRYIRAVTGLGPHDCTAGYKCWRREALAKIPLSSIASEGYAFQVEMLFEADAAGCRIDEVPIIFVERRAGASKVCSRVIIESVLMPWRLLGRRLLRQLHLARNPQRALAPRAH
jgi:dolichol-phosphate mannosyltransferase